MKKLLLTFFMFSSVANAAFIIDTNTGYYTSSDAKTSSSVTDMNNSIFIGASLGQRQTFFLGQNISLVSQEVKTASSNKISTTELGPRLIYFLSEAGVFYVTFAWNPYAKGTRSLGTADETISGWSYSGGLGAQVKINRNFNIGVCLNYRSLTVTETTNASKVTSTVSNAYSSMMPMINFSLRFH